MKRLRQRVEIQNPTITQNEYQDTVIAWAKLVDRWVSLTPVSSKEVYHADQIVSETTHKLEVYFDTTLQASFTAASKVVWGSREFELTGSPINKEENTRMMIEAELKEIKPK